MRILYLGNQLLGCRCLEHLIACGEKVCGVCALPEGYWKEVSGSEEGTAWFPSVARVAEAAGIPVLRPRDINAPDIVTQLRALGPDLIFSVSWDQMLDADLLSLPPLGCINMHDSLLPRHRGHAPVNWAIIHGDSETGMTLHYMVARADAGDIIAQRRVPIFFEDRAIDVFTRVVDAGVELFKEMLPLIKTGHAPRIPLDLSAGCYGPRRRPVDGKIDWTCSAVQVHNFVRALTRPYPGAFSFLDKRKLFIWKGQPAEGESLGFPPGTLLRIKGSSAVLATTGQGFYRIESADFEDDKKLDASEWLSAAAERYVRFE